MKKIVVVCNDVNHAKLMVVDRKIRYEIIGNIQIIQVFESLLEVERSVSQKANEHILKLNHHTQLFLVEVADPHNTENYNYNLINLRIMQ